MRSSRLKAATLAFPCLTIRQLSRFPEYSSDLRTFPVSLDGRIKRLRGHCKVDGPLKAHAENLLPLLVRLLELDEGRQYFVHGYCAFYTIPGGGMAMQFRRFVPPAKGERGGPVTRRDMLVRPSELRDARDRWALFAESALHIFREIYSDLGLEEPDLLPIERQRE